ncbi:hypothetical protein CUMW_082130 [Citrus unshiu]|nr:hypothetical protein CUMW_082130 [Citrus unshiu]
MEFHNEKLVRLIVFPENYEPLRRKILDPSSDIFLKWNRLFLCWCLVALFVDPLYFYLPSVVHSGNSSRMTSDLNFGIIMSLVFELLPMYFICCIWLLSSGQLMFPLILEFLEEIMIWFILPAVRSSHADHTNNALGHHGIYCQLNGKQHAGNLNAKTNQAL